MSDPHPPGSDRAKALIGDPPVLPTRVAAQVAWTSIKVRMSRSLVTVSSVVLAVAFLLVVLGSEIGNARVYARFQAASQPYDDVVRVQRFLTLPRTGPQFLADLERDGKGLTTWAAGLQHPLPGLEAAGVERALELLGWVESLKPSQRYLLLRNRRPASWLLGLGDPGAAENLMATSADFTGTRLPFDEAGLAALVADVPALAATLEALAAAEQARLGLVAAASHEDRTGNRAVLGLIRSGADDKTLAAAGLPIDQVLPDQTSPRLAAVREQLALGALRRQAQRIVMTVHGEAAKSQPERTVKPLTLRQLVDGTASGHPDLDAALAALAEGLGNDQLDRLLADLQTRRDLDTLRSTFADLNYNPSAGRSRTVWLVVLSLMVCIVGIVNSMMMAVTERFREIATMKCLGAVDGFILKAFLIESGSVGLVGAAVGVVIGLVLVLVQASARFGGAFWAAPPLAHLLLALVGALACGLVLTVFGALLPAYRAARMHPIEAMRLET